MKLSILLIDSDVKRRAAISFMLRAGDVHVEPFESVEELDFAWSSPDAILVFDDGRCIKSLVRAMLHHSQWLPIVAYASGARPRQIADAVLDGAIDYLEWPCEQDDLIAVLQGIEQRAQAYPLSGDRVRSARARARIDVLTKREAQVLVLVSEGLSNRQIGKELGISSRTVQIHRSHIIEKIGARSTPDAVRLAVEAGILPEAAPTLDVS